MIDEIYPLSGDGEFVKDARGAVVVILCGETSGDWSRLVARQMNRRHRLRAIQRRRDAFTVWLGRIEAGGPIPKWVRQELELDD